MARFNKKTTMKEKNLSDFDGFKRTDSKKELVSIILNSMHIKDNFYQSESEQMRKIEKFTNEIIEEDPVFILKLAVYTRTVMNLRSITTILNRIIAENIKGKKETRRAFYRTLVRPDDATELVAYWNQLHPKDMIPNAVRKAIKESFENKWDAYQLKKYFGTKGSVKVSDLINLSHPKPKSDYEELMFKQALENNLPAIQTAQTINACTTGSERAKSYMELLDRRKLGLMAALKNIKNIIEAIKDSENINQHDLVKMLTNLLQNENAIKKSRVLPFRFYDAYTATKNLNYDRFIINSILDALNKGFTIACGNVELVGPEERVAILVDDSASMTWDGNMFKNALVLSAAASRNIDQSITVFFSSDARIDTASVHDLEWAASKRAQSGGTNMAAAIGKIIDTKLDKIIIFTDMQQNTFFSYANKYYNANSIVEEYKSKHGYNIQILFWNLAPYGGSTPLMMSNNVLEVNGFSEKMLDVIPKIWKDKDALIKEIESIKL